MNRSPRDADKTGPVPVEEKWDDNHLTSLDEPEKTPAPGGEAPSVPDRPEDAGDEQHDAGHGDIHPCNEVWK